MNHYLNSGANSYLYWNISLPEGGFSRWGWQQNSLITVNSEAKTYKFNHEYYLLKHLSHYVKPGARLLRTEGAFTNLLAFRNQDDSVVLLVQNDSGLVRTVTLSIDNQMVELLLDANSFNTFNVR